MISSAGVTTLARALRGLTRLNDEISRRKIVQSERFETGVIAFRPRSSSGPNAIVHEDKDVVCYVLRGRGRLRLEGRRIPLAPGAICHIPKGTRHDFAAAKANRLMLLYTIIERA